MGGPFGNCIARAPTILKTNWKGGQYALYLVLQRTGYIEEETIEYRTKPKLEHGTTQVYLNTLSIDEVFALTSEVRDSMDYVLPHVDPHDLSSALPFGERQALFAGDPFQFGAIKHEDT